MMSTSDRLTRLGLLHLINNEENLIQELKKGYEELMAERKRRQ